MPWDLPLVIAGEPGSDMTAGQDGATIRRTVLPGGVRVLSESMPGLRSVTMGAWVGVGSRDETSGHLGSTHFLEHLLFKGTPTRSAMDIAEAFDAVGGEANAATGKEYTCYYARVLDSDLPMAVDVVSDMVTSAIIDPDELEVERGVILEELAMDNDDPTDVVHEEFARAVLGDHELGRPIGGTPESIRDVPRDAVYEHYRAHYAPETLVVAAAGGVDHDALCSQVVDALDRGGWDLDPAKAPRARRSTTLLREPGAPVALDLHRGVEQANIIVGTTGLSGTDKRRFALSILNAVLGGGMSSRLFQEIRERRGLAYSTYSFASGFAETGTFGLYAGCAPGRVDEVTELLGTELDRLAAAGITQTELDRSIGQHVGGLALGLEDSGSRMNRLSRFELVHGRVAGVDEAIAQIRAVTIDDVADLAADLASRPRSTVRVAPFEGR